MTNLRTELKDLAEGTCNFLNSKSVRNDITKEDMESYLGTLVEMSLLGEDDTIFQGSLLSEWKVWNTFAGLVLPAKISLSGKRSDIDLRNIEGCKKGSYSTLKKHEFLELQDKIYNKIYRKSLPDDKTKSLSELKTHILLTAVENIQQGDFCQTDKGFPLLLRYEFIKKDYCGYDVKSVYYDMLREKMD